MTFFCYVYKRFFILSRFYVFNVFCFNLNVFYIYGGDHLISELGFVDEQRACGPVEWRHVAAGCNRGRTERVETETRRGSGGRRGGCGVAGKDRHERCRRVERQWTESRRAESAVGDGIVLLAGRPHSASCTSNTHATTTSRRNRYIQSNLLKQVLGLRPGTWDLTMSIHLGGVSTCPCFILYTILNGTRPYLRKYQYKSINYAIHSKFRKIFNTRSQEIVDVCLEMFNCLQAEQTIAIRKRKFLNKFSIIHNGLCRVFVANDKTELESCCTDVYFSN